jgi:hypothetical protein
MRVYIVGEDDVTLAVIKRVLAHCSADYEIIQNFPARGGQIKSKIIEFNKISETYPVVLLIDLDNDDCAPLLIKKLIKDKNENFIFNIAVDEADAWLMADREGFASYFRIKMEDMPSARQTKQGGKKAVTEMSFRYKSSMYLTHELIQKSKNTEYVQQLTPKKNAAKGPEYNSCMLPFIQDAWNIDNARQNSDSLNRMVLRLEKLIRKQE